MVKNNKNKTSISNDVFKLNLNRYSDNLARINKELGLAENDLKFFEVEAKIRKGKNMPIEPKFEYELLPEWREYLETITEYFNEQKIIEKKSKVYALKQSVKLESARVRLISEGVPAWEGNYDNERLAQEYERQNPSS